MSHEIDSMMYVGARPWHGLGTKLAGVANAEEALAAAGLDWTVSKKPIFLMDGTEVADNFAIVRDDNSVPLGVVGKTFHPLQNKAAFSLCDAIVGLKEAIYHTAGSLRGGQFTWMLAKLPGTIRVVNDDLVEKFLLFSNAHNGTRAARMIFTPIRVVCANTHNVAMQLAKAELERAKAAGQAAVGQAWMRHTKNIGVKVEEARRALGIVSVQYDVYEQAAKRLAATQVTMEAWKKYTERVELRPKDKSDRELPEATRTLLEEVTGMFEHGRGNDLPGVKGTAWAAFNAVVEYADYARSTDKDDTRTKSVLFGSGARLKQKAWDEALVIAGGVR